MSEKLIAYYKKFTSLLLSVLVLFTTTFMGAPQAKNPISATQHQYTFNKNRILIGGYSYNLNFSDDLHVGYVREAGIDFLVSPVTETFLDACERNGVGIIAKNYGGLPAYGWTNIDDTPNSPWLTMTSESFQDHPALWGNDLMDEPSVSSFDALSKMVNSYYSKTNGKIPYINLYPAYADEEQLGTTADWYAFSDDYKHVNTYQKHVNAYLETIDSDYISADIYPLFEKKDAATGKTVYRTEETWLKNLDILAEACRNTNRDLWVIMQSIGQPFEGTSSVQRIPDETDLRWQMYTSLSFGAKAIIHACYQNGWWDDASHLVDKNGERTPTYYAAQTVNKEIHAISDTYMAYNNIGAFVHNAIKEPHTRMALSKVNFNAVSDIKSDETLLFGCFEAKESSNRAFTVVNMTEIGDQKTADVSFKLNGAKKVTAYIKGVPTTLTPAADGNYSLSLKSGEGVFVTLAY